MKKDVFALNYVYQPRKVSYLLMENCEGIELIEFVQKLSAEAKFSDETEVAGTKWVVIKP